MRHIVFFCLAMCLVGCHTQKGATRSSRKVTPEQQLAQKVIVAQPLFQTAEAKKVRMKVDYAGRSITANGSIAVITDSILVLSVQPLLGIEMLRVEMTPQTMLVVDKMNRRYVQMPYETLAQTIGLPLCFTDLQAVFLNRMFVMGKEQATLSQLPFTSSIIEDEHWLQLQDQMLIYGFSIAPQTYALTAMFAQMGEISCSVKYENHQWKDGVYFPKALLFRVNKGNHNVAECKLTLLDVLFNQEVKIRQTDLSRYNEVGVQQLLH